jgi:hypothetical protein
MANLDLPSDGNEHTSDDSQLKFGNSISGRVNNLSKSIGNTMVVGVAIFLAGNVAYESQKDRTESAQLQAEADERKTYAMEELAIASDPYRSQVERAVALNTAINALKSYQSANALRLLGEPLVPGYHQFTTVRLLTGVDISPKTFDAVCLEVRGQIGTNSSASGGGAEYIVKNSSHQQQIVQNKDIGHLLGTDKTQIIGH